MNIIQKENGLYKITVTCPMCREEKEVEHDFTEAEIELVDLYLNGFGYAQDTLSFLSPAQREQFISRVCPECFNKMFEM